MPIELLLSPIMRPLVLAKAVLFHPHRETSRYVPNIIDVGPVSTQTNPTSVKSYTVRREFGQGAKVYGVFDDANPIKHIDQRLYWFVRSLREGTLSSRNSSGGGSGSDLVALVGSNSDSLC